MKTGRNWSSCRGRARFRIGRQRAAIILGYYERETIASIGRRLGMTRLSVSK